MYYSEVTVSEILIYNTVWKERKQGRKERRGGQREEGTEGWRDRERNKGRDRETKDGGRKERLRKESKDRKGTEERYKVPFTLCTMPRMQFSGGELA